MNKRVTITIDEDIEKKVREAQAKQIIENNKAVSFSFVINKILRDGLNNHN